MADKPFLSLSGLSEVWAAIKSKFQEKLVSGTNIKTINNSSILGSGNINLVSSVKGDAESSYRTGNVNLTAANVKAVPLQTSGGIKSCSGGGNNWYYILATITITSTYINRPLVFEISGRGTNISWVQVMFQSVNDLDPGLLSFSTNNSNEYYIKKTSTSNWTIYGKYNETWGLSSLHRITGAGADIGVTVQMVNFGMDAPTDVQQATYFGKVAYATSAGSATDSTKLPLAGGTLTGRLTTSKPINQILTGTGTAGSDKGSGVSPRYFPAKWTFNTGMTPTNGDIITIKMPIAGHDYGVFVSINNGASYHPVSRFNNNRLTTHYANGSLLTLVFKSDGQTDSVFALNGADARSNVSGGCWVVMNHYTDGNTIASCRIETSAGTQAKSGWFNNFVNKNPCYFQAIVCNANTYAGAITLNINSQGAKPVYINGSASSASNYTLPAGTYIVYYDGTNYYFRTDNKLTVASITGTADGNGRAYVQTTAPGGNNKNLWIDSATGVAKYWNGSSWTPIKAVWE